MICDICKQTFSVSLTFETLFSSPRICHDCQRLYLGALWIETIPLVDGEVEYVSLTEVDKLSYEIRNSLWFQLDKPLKMAISHDYEYGLVLLIDRTEFETFSAWSFLLHSQNKVLLISVERFDFSCYERLF